MTMLKRLASSALIPLAALAIAVNAQEGAFQLSGGVTVLALYPDDSRIEDDQTLSADLYLQRRLGKHQWLIYVEGNSSLDEEAASTVLIETNADAGSARDPDRSGRVQISEVNYQIFRDNGGRLTLGLLDASSYLDRTRITNDENIQFLGASFVNNPTIEFPDYTLGIVYEKPGTANRPQINAVLTSSNGLADNPNLSYSQLIRFGDDDDGAFAALGLGWVADNRLIRFGAWLNTRPHQTLVGDETNEKNYGAYAVFGRSWRSHALNLRVGLANDNVSVGSEFAALAYRYRWHDHALGIGVAQAFLSDKIDGSGLDDSAQLEIFGRFTINNAVHLTASVQGIRHSGFVAGNSDPRDSVLVGGLRFHYAF